MLEVRRTTAGPQIFVSRTHKGFLRRLFELEVPEIHSRDRRDQGHRPRGRQPLQGRRRQSRQEGLDPVGATVGQRGARVQAVVAELGGEKIDVIPWNDDPAVFVANALQPGPGRSASTSTRSTGSPASPCPSGCSRWPSAARARTPGWPPG